MTPPQRFNRLSDPHCTRAEYEIIRSELDRTKGRLDAALDEIKSLARRAGEL